MALELRRGLVLRRGGVENAAATFRRRCVHCHWRETADARVLILHRHAAAVRFRRNRSKRTFSPHGDASPGEGAQQALTRSAGGLVHTPASPSGAGAREAAADEGFTGEEERGNECGVFRKEMPALRRGEDAAVADGTDGTEDAVQRVRREVQVRAAGSRVPAGGEPDIRVDEAFEFASEGFGAEAAEGDASTAASAIDESEFNFRRIQRWRRVLDPSSSPSALWARF